MAAQRTGATLSDAAAGAVGERPRAALALRGSGMPLLFLHGWGTSSALFEPVLQPLARGRWLIVPDLPGFGDTPEPPEPWGPLEYADWTRLLLDRLQVERCDIVAHSNGARIALHLAGLHPERVQRMVLTGAAGLRRRHTPLSWMQVRSYKLLRRMQRSRLLPASTRRVMQERADRRGSDDYRAASGVMRATLVRLVNSDVRPLLKRIAAPTLLVWGSDDDMTPVADARLMERLIPDAGLVVFEHAGHYAYLEQVQRFARIVDVFLAGGR